MIKVKGCLAGSTKYSILRPVSMEAYWADQENGKFDSLYWGCRYSIITIGATSGTMMTRI